MSIVVDLGAYTCFAPIGPNKYKISHSTTLFPNSAIISWRRIRLESAGFG